MRNLIAIGLSILLLAFMSCKSGGALTGEQQEVKVLWVNSSKVPCTGVGPMQCLEVQETSEIDEGKWTYFYSSIEGFEFRPGKRYRIKVSVEKLPQPIPADASSSRYRLIEVIEEYAYLL
jgi:heat shock protein HslJ